MAYSLSPWLKPRFFITGTNRPLAGGLMYTYKAGTTDPATTYSDDAGTTNTNPIQLDSDGQCDLFLDDAVSYRIILKNSAGVTQFDKDRIASIGNTQVQSFNSIAALRLKIGTTAANSAQTLGYYSAGDGGGALFYWNSTSSASDNDGTIIKPTSLSGAGRWIAVLSDSINIRQFGAKMDGSNDDSSSINVALDYAKSAGIDCVVSGGTARISNTIYIPYGVTFRGMGMNEGSNTYPSIIKANANFVNGDMIRFKGVADGSRLLWGGKIRCMTILGNTSATGTQRGISLRDINNNVIATQDTSVFEDLYIRGCKSGGMEFPNGAIPVTFNRIKLLWNNGPGIYIKSGANFHQSMSFIDVSGDGNNGGLLSFEDLDANGSVVIMNLKSERRINVDYGSVDLQENAIKFTNCANTPVTIIGATHISSIRDGATFKKPGDLVKIVSGTSPLISWSAVAIRIRAGDTGTDPYIISNGSSSVPYTQTVGYFCSTSTIGFYSDNNLLKGVFGAGGAFIPAGPADNVWQVQGSTPGLSLYESDASANEKTWSIDASAGGFRIRSVDDSGSASIVMTISRSAGTPLKLSTTVPITPSVYTIATLPIASSASNAITLISDPAVGKGRCIYSDGAGWFYISDNSAV